jgi:hypothetical protein
MAMKWMFTGFCALVLMASSCQEGPSKKIAQQAYQHTQAIVDVGPRTVGSANLEKVREYLRTQVAKHGLVMQEQPFEAQTPQGVVPMRNLFVQIPGKTAQRILLVAHYDSKIFKNFEFLGANDAASSVGLLLALVPWLQKMNLDHTVEMVWVDGEEALVSWSATDSLYGSRHFADNLTKTENIQAVMVVDMISDHNLQLIRNRNMDPLLMKYYEQVLDEMNQSDLLDTKMSFVADDHEPFVRKGLPTLHFMDFSYTGKTIDDVIWHTQWDTMDEVSKDSLQTMAEILMRIIGKVDASS